MYIVIHVHVVLNMKYTGAHDGFFHGLHNFYNDCVFYLFREMR